MRCVLTKEAKSYDINYFYCYVSNDEFTCQERGYTSQAKSNGKNSEQKNLEVMFDPDLPICQNFYLPIIYVCLKLCSYEMKLHC